LPTILNARFGDRQRWKNAGVIIILSAIYFLPSLRLMLVGTYYPSFSMVMVLVLPFLQYGYLTVKKQFSYRPFQFSIFNK
jgi:hypothetical protein